MNSKEVARNPMPRLWNYIHEDQTTWKYIDCIIAGKEKSKVKGKESKNEPYVSKWIRNPLFKYSHLSRY